MPASSIVRLLLLAAIWGASFLFMRVLAPELGALLTATARVALAAVGLWVIVLTLGSKLDFKGLLPATLALGALNSGLPFLLFSLAALSLPAGYSAILNATAPLMGLIVGLLFFSSSMNHMKLLGVGVGIAGVALLTQIGPVDVSAALLLGIGACLGATFCYGLASYLTKRWITERGGLDSKLVALGSQMGASLLLLPILLMLPGESLWKLLAASATIWVALILLSVVCTSIAYILYFRLIADVGPQKALGVTYVVPVFGVAWGTLFLGEALSSAHFLGGGLIALSIWLSLWEKKT